MRQQGEPPERARQTGDGVPAPTAYARTYRVRDIVVVELRGDLDLGCVAYVDTHLEAAAHWPAPLVVVLDLGQLRFADCFGLSLLVRARRRIMERGGRVRMVCTHPPTRKLLALTGLEGAFQPVDTLDEALDEAPDGTVIPDGASES